MQLNNLSKEQFSNMGHIYGRLQGRKCAILENQSTTTIIESCPLTILGRPKMKNLLTSYHKVCGIGRGVYKPLLFFLVLACSCWNGRTNLTIKTINPHNYYRPNNKTNTYVHPQNFPQKCPRIYQQWRQQDMYV